MTARRPLDLKIRLLALLSIFGLLPLCIFLAGAFLGVWLFVGVIVGGIFLYEFLHGSWRLLVQVFTRP